jgi:branched-chain amino acid transport system permease protein
MIGFLLSYQSIFDTICIFSGFAFSQFIALRGGLFAISTAGFAAIGAYAAAIAVTAYGIHPILAVTMGTAFATLTGLLLSLPLARLRGHFQAIATLAFVEIVRNAALYFDGLTGGPRGINAIPKLVTTWHVVAMVVVISVMLAVIKRTSVGRAFDAVRQDDTVARSLGVSVISYQMLAFGLSAGIAGISGALLAFNTYSINPDEFGFPLIVTSIGAVVLGGRNSVVGPIVGTAVLELLPEVARPLADNRTLFYGAVLMLTIAYLPSGIVDTVRSYRMTRTGAVLPPATVVAVGD